MRNIYQYFLIVLFISAAGAGCEKESTGTGVSFAPTPLPNSAPKVNAGQDIWINLPVDSCILTGSAKDAEDNIEKYYWRQISRPQISNLGSPDLAQTKVSNFKQGSYVFELTVTDKAGLTGSDTVSVFVQDLSLPGHAEVIFNDLKWTCPMGCSIQISCLSCYVPVNSVFKVYVRRDNTNQWQVVVPEAQWTSGNKYTYSIYDNNLFIFSYDDFEGHETPDIMIVY